MKKHRFLQLLVALLFTQCFPVPKVAGQFTETEFEEMATEMAQGDTRDIEVASLKTMKDKVILLDTREKKEYEISHIPGAIWVGYNNFKLKRVKEIAKDAKIITYCSVGYRSERIGEKLQKAGFTDVSNLKGSIFKWVNEGNPLEDKEGNATDKVHGFDKTWGKWVKGDKAVY